MINPQEMISTNTLEALRFSIRKHLDPYELYDLEVQQYEDFAFSLGESVAWEFRTNIFADKLADETHTVSKQVRFDVEADEWKSAWQLWKYNHWHAWWFTYFGFLYFCSSPKKTTREFRVARQANLKFDVKKYVTFPEIKKNYPQTLGNHFRYVEITPGSIWLDS